MALLVYFRFPIAAACVIHLLTVNSALCDEPTKNTTLVHELFGGDCSGLAMDGTTMYAVLSTWIVSMDVSNPAEPRFLDTLDWGAKLYDPPFTEFCRGIVVNNGYVYMLSYYQGIIIIDATNPADLKRIDTVAVPTTERMMDIHGWDNNFIVNDGYKLYLFDASVPRAPIMMSLYQSFANRFSTGLFVSPAYSIEKAYALIMEITPPDFRDFLHLKSVNPDLSLTEIKEIGEITGYFTLIKKSGNYLFVGQMSVPEHNYSDYIRVYSIDDSFNVSFLSEWQLWTEAIDLHVAGNYVYTLQSSSASFFVTDISNVYEPELVASYYLPYSYETSRMFVLGDYVYYNTRAKGLLVVRVDIPTNVERAPAPSSLALAPAYPNPVSGSTSISYSLPGQEYITLEVYNMLGQKVQTLYSGLREPGSHTARLDASALPAGTYRVALRSGSGVRSEMVVVR